MSGPTPVNLSALEAKQAQRAARQTLADQVLSKDRLIEDMDQGFNPAAAERAQSRLNRFRPLESRRRVPDAAHSRIEQVDTKSEEDLAHDFGRRNPELPPSRLRTLRQKISNQATEQEILEEVSAAFEDPTLADEALEYLDRTTSGQLQAKVRLARGLLNAEKGREIIAGRNIDPAAKSFFQKGLAQSPTELRDLYRDITGNPREHNALFTELSAKYSFDDLKKVVAFLLQGMSYDLKSKGPSIQQAELMLLMSEIRDLQSILWIYLFFKGRLKLLRKMFAQQGLAFSKALTFERLAKDFIKLVEERYPTMMKLLKALEELGLLDEAKVLVLSQYREAIRMLSPRVYKSVRHKQDLLGIIIEALTELEEEEEEEE